MSGEVLQQRQMLEQTRGYLTELQQELEQPGRKLSAIAAEFQTDEQTAQAAESAQHLLQGILQEMNYLRTNMLQPLRAEVESLQQQRRVLSEEVSRLEAQTRQYALPPAANQQLVIDFLQSAMQQLQDNLAGQVTQIMTTLVGQTPAGLLGSGTDPQQTALTTVGNSTSIQHLQQFQQVQSQADQLVMSLDSSLQVVFDALQRNIQGYQDSLEQGLNRMHNLGQQGEVMFAALANRLAEQLGRETSSYLQSSLRNPALPESALGAGENVDSRKNEIDQLLSELNALDINSGDRPSDDTGLVLPEKSNGVNPGFDALPLLPELEALNLELEDLDLVALPLEGEFPAEADSLLPLSDSSPFFQLEEEDDLSLLQTEVPASDSLAIPSEESDEELESALDLFNQLNGETSAESDFSPELTWMEGFESLETEATSTPIAETEIIAPSASLDEDEFYQTLFGDSSESEAAPVEPTLMEDMPTELPQAVENVLLQPPQLPVDSESTEELTEPIETIAMLSELSPVASDVATASSVATDASSVLSEEIYESAQPGEDLVVADSVDSEARLDFELALETLERLRSDLSNLSDAETNSSTAEEEPLRDGPLTDQVGLDEIQVEGLAEADLAEQLDPQTHPQETPFQDPDRFSSSESSATEVTDPFSTDPFSLEGLDNWFEEEAAPEEPQSLNGTVLGEAVEVKPLSQSGSISEEVDFAKKKKTSSENSQSRIWTLS
jgi:hypothetical protein